MLADKVEKERLDWKEAVRQSCLLRNKITCSSADVFDDHNRRVSRPDEFEHWPIECIATRLRELVQENRAKVSKGASSSSYLVNAVTSTLRSTLWDATHLLKAVIQPKSDYQTETKVDDGLQVPWDMCFAAVQIMHQATFLETPTVVPVSTFHEWLISRLDPAETLVPWIKALPPTHFDVLTQAIDLPSHVDEEKTEEFYCFGVENCSDTVDAHITIYKLDNAMGRNQQLLEDYQQKADTCLAQARKHKHVSTFKRYKLYTQHMENAQAALLNLATVRERVVEQLGQRDVVAALEQAVSIMAKMRLETDTLDNLMDGLAEQINDSQMVQEILGGLPLDGQVSEDELLAELEALNLGDDDTAAPTSRTGDVGGAGLPPIPLNGDGLDKPAALSVRESDTTKFPATLS